MVIFDTVGVVVVIGDERSALQGAAAGSAAETVGMETLTHRLQDTVCDPLPTEGTHSQRFLETHNHTQRQTVRKSNALRKNKQSGLLLSL